MIETFIQNLWQSSIPTLERMESEWFCTSNPARDFVLCNIINVKLIKYEDEY